MTIIVFAIGIIIGVILYNLIQIIPQNMNIKSIKFNEQLSDEKSSRQKPEYYIILLLTGTLFLISYLKIGLNLILLKVFIFDSILIVVSFIDLKHHLIPNKIVVFIFISGLVFVFFKDITILNALLGMLIGGIILFLLSLMPGGLGGGDVKFMFAIGLYLGLKKTLIGLYIGFILGGIISLILLVFKLKSPKDKIPYGPMLTIGSFISYHFFS